LKSPSRSVSLLPTLSPELRVLAAPFARYREAVSGASPDSSSLVPRAAVAAAFTAFVIGTCTAITATGRVSWRLALSGAICWSFVPILQLLTAAAVLPSRAVVPRRRALELFFLGHAAWSLWLLAAAASLVAGVARTDVVLVTGVVPAVWTSVVVYAFCREVLGLTARRAAARTLAHQTLTCLLIVLYVAWAVQLWPRVLSLGLR
jgi:hypothetical protein